MSGIIDTAPAKRWEDAFLAGNGTTGAMVLGDPHHERVIVDDHRFVLPNGTAGLRAPEIADRLEEVRDLILAGRRRVAQELHARGHHLQWTPSFHPGWAVTIDMPEHGPVRDYSRRTDFATGEIIVGWTDDAGRCERRLVVSRADGAILHHLTLPSGQARISLTGDLPGRPADITYAVAASDDGTLTIRADYPLGGHFGGTTRVLAARTSTDGAAVVVQGPGTVLLVSTVDGSGDPPVLDGDYKTLLARHVALHRELYERVSLAFDLPPGARDVAVADLAGPVLLERLFHSGRYLFISSCGTLPPRLTGLWLGEWGAAWSGDYTTDANVNLQMAGAAVGALPEAAVSYSALIAGQVAHWRDNARRLYGTRGILAPSRTDGFSGHTFHFDADWPLQMWVAGADWLLLPLWEHWQVTGDDGFLADVLAPWLVEAAEFFEDYLTRVGDDGRVVIVPSYSPENSPGGTDMASVNATMDIAAARHALSCAIEACTRLGVDPDAVARWTALRERLPDYVVDARGALAEWAWPGLDAHEDHRHISHLYPVWPLHDITPQETTELAAAASRALASRRDENRSAHGSLHRALAAARLKDADGVAANLEKILGADMLFRSLMTSHNPGREIYNADAAHTVPAVLLEALVDSTPGRLEFLPAFPSDLPGGELRGVTCRGGVVVERLTWTADRARITATIVSRTAQEVTVHPGAAPVELAAGVPLEIEIVKGVVVCSTSRSPQPDG